MNHKGESKNSIWIIIALVVVGYLLYSGGYLSSAAPATGASQVNVATPANTYISTGTTTLNIVSTDAQQSGTAVGAVAWVSINADNAYKSGVSSAAPNDVLNILVVNNSRGYHAAFIPNHKVPASPQDTINVPMKGNATLTMTLFNTNNQVMDSAGATYNQTVATGGAYNMQLRIDGQDKKDTQDMRCILEASNNAKVDKLTLSGFGATYIGMAKPSSYTLAASTSQVWVYDVAPIVGATSVTGTVGMQSKTGQSAANTYFKVTCDTKEYFIDSLTGKVVYDIENSAGTAQSLGSTTTTGYFS